MLDSYVYVKEHSILFDKFVFIVLSFICIFISIKSQTNFSYRSTYLYQHSAIF